MSGSPSSASTSSCTTLTSRSPRRCQHAGYENGCFVDIDWVDSEEINDSTADKLLGEVDGIILPGGFGVARR